MNEESNTQVITTNLLRIQREQLAQLQKDFKAMSIERDRLESANRDLLRALGLDNMTGHHTIKKGEGK